MRAWHTFNTFRFLTGLIFGFQLLIGSNGLAQDFDMVKVKKLVESFQKTNRISAVAISLIQNGKHKEIYFGNADPLNNKPTTEQTLFEIGSITKVFTPHLMSVAQEEGKLSIQDPVSKYIPELRANPIFNQMTLRDLATHTSGLPGALDAPRAKNFKSKEDLFKWFLKWKPPVPPKSKYVYSNVGIAMIGYALENIYHEKLEQLLKTKILNPRKMISTFQTVPGDKKKEIAQGFDSQQKKAELLPDDYLFYPAGLLKTNASDLGAYVASWDSQFFKYLDASLCFSNHSCQGLGIEIHPLRKLAATFTNTEFTIHHTSDPSIKAKETMPPLNQVFIDKTGSSDGMSSYIAMIPNKNIGVVVLCNQWNVSDRVSLGRKILQIYK